MVSAGRGQRRAWWTPRGLNNFNADSPYIKFDSTFEEMIVSPNIRAHQHAYAVQRTILELAFPTWTTLIKGLKEQTSY